MRFRLRWKILVAVTFVVVAVVALHITLPADARVLFAGLTSVLLLLFAALLYWWVDRPLHRVIEFLDNVSTHQYLTRAPEKDADEFGKLGAGYNRLLERITELDATRIDQDRQLKWAQEKLQLEEGLARKSATLERRLRERELLADLARTFSSSLEIDAVLNTVCKQIANVLSIDEVAILIVDPATEDLVVSATAGVPKAEQIHGLRFSIGEGVTGRVWAGEGPVYISDVTNDESFLHWKGKHQLKEASFYATLMEFGGEKLGVVDFTRHKTDGFSPTVLEMLEIIVQWAAIAIRNARLYERTLVMAKYDELTGLLNRRTFTRRLEAEWRRRLRFGAPVSLLLIDVDRFKEYNDKHGHLIGDQVLVHVAKTLRANVRRVDMVARFGGEEFIVMLTRTNLETATAVGEKLRAAVEQADTSAYGVRAPTISVGVACVMPKADGIEPIELVDAADKALLRAKSGGRNRLEVASD